MVFIITPRFGLCNQLLCIANGIVIANKFNRDLIINKFQKNWNGNINENLCTIEDIIDIEKFNILLNNLQIKIKILSNIDNKIIESSDYIKFVPGNIHDCKNIINYINIDINITKSRLILGNIVSQEFNDINDVNLKDQIKVQIPFNNLFYQIANNIKKELNLNNNYQSCHLRIEDDAILCFSDILKINTKDYNTKLINFYNKNILDCNKIYICSGLDLPNNIANSISILAKKVDVPIYEKHLNYQYYKDLINNNNILVRNKINNEFISDHRELNAIVDLLIAYDGSYFIGSGVSSFSLFIANYFRLNNKKNILLNI